MDEHRKIFYPVRAPGLLFNLGISAGLALLAAALFLLATNTAIGPIFLAYLLGALSIATPIPFLVYRTFSLVRSKYELERNGIHLKWGFREEDIPFSEVSWVELAEDLIVPLQFPRTTWPGAVVGITHQEGLGLIEFLAGEKQELVMIGTSQRVFVISPGNAKAFVRVYQELIELGSLAPLQPYSNQPRFLLVDIWRAPVTRILLLITMVFSLALFVVVGLSIPELSQVSLGFNAQTVPLPPVAPGQLLLLPSINLALVIASYLLSLAFLRNSEMHPIMTVLWGGNAFTSILFLLAVFFILRAG